MAYITGPERHGKRWRVRVEHGRKKCPCCDKRRHDLYYSTEAEAKREAKILRVELAGARSIEWAITEYLSFLRDGRRVSNAHLYKTESRIRSMVGDATSAPITSITDARAQELYSRLVDSSSSDTTQLNTLSQCRGWFRWLVRKRYVDVNPFDSVDPVGQRRARARGQALSDDEAGQLWEWCQVHATDDSTIAALALSLGMRAGEIAGITPRDIDAGATVIVVRRGKTAAAIRKLEPPPWLAKRMPAFAEGVRDRFAVNRAVRRATKAAGVTVVGPHALRATCASVAERSGAPWQFFGPALGHTGPAVTHGHYIRPGASESARADTISRKLGAHRSKRTPKPPGGAEEDK